MTRGYFVCGDCTSVARMPRERGSSLLDGHACIRERLSAPATAVAPLRLVREPEVVIAKKSRFGRLAAFLKKAAAALLGFLLFSFRS